MMTNYTRTHSMNVWCRTGLAAVLVLSMAACSSDSDGIPENDDPAGDDRPGLIVEGLAAANDTGAEAVSPWLMVVNLFRRESITPGTGDGRIYMRRYADDFPISRFVDFYTPELDTCEINDGDSSGGGSDNPPPPRISMGDTLTISTASGPWFTFEQSLDDGEPVFDTNNGLPGALPSDATLSVAAGDYPAISNYPLFEPVAPVRLLPDATEPLTRDAAYSWMPGDPKGYLKILLLAYDANNEFQGFKVSCDVVDDGSFTMPEDVRSFVDVSHNRLEVRYDRVINRIDVVNGIVIRQQSEVAE